MFNRKKTEVDDEKARQAADRAALKSCKIYTLAECPPNPWRIESLPVQRLIDKMARDNTLDVCTMSFDEKTKSAHYVVAVNAHDTKEVNYTYEDLCKNFGWDSFSLTRNKQTIKPHWTEPVEM